MDPNYRKDLEDKIANSLIQQLEQNTIQEDELNQIAHFVLQRIDLITSHSDLISFLEDLTTQWPSFSNLLKMEEGKVQKIEDQKAAQNVLQLIKDGEYKEAIKISSEVINS